MIAKGPGSQSEHGTNAKYRGGCRCEPCILAMREYARENQRARRRLAAAREQREHGEPGYEWHDQGVVITEAGRRLGLR